MTLVTVDNCPACEIVKRKHPEIETRKPTLKEITTGVFKKFPTLITDFGNNLEGLASIGLFLDAPGEDW